VVAVTVDGGKEGVEALTAKVHGLLVRARVVEELVEVDFTPFRTSASPVFVPRGSLKGLFNRFEHFSTIKTKRL